MMNHLKVLSCGALACLGAAGCLAPQPPEPQQIVLPKDDTNQVLLKDLYEIHSDRILDFGRARVFPLLSGSDDKVFGGYDIRVIVIEPDESTAVFSENVSQVMYCLSGGGMLMINGKAQELREGIAIYVPGKTPLQIVNNSPLVLKYMSVSSPSSKQLPDIIKKAVPKAPESEVKPLSDKDILKKSEEVVGNDNTSPTLDQISPVTLTDDKSAKEIMKKSEIIKSGTIKPTNDKNIQTLTPQEEKAEKDK